MTFTEKAIAIHELTSQSPEALRLAPELWAFDKAPRRYFVQGTPRALETLDRLPELGFAVVGTRSPQPRSLNLVRRVVNRLSGSGLVVISGLARGIDAEAHEAALEAGLTTIAVVASGLDRIYPPENEGLLRRILEHDGLAVTELPPGTAPLPNYFLLRNRIISAWARATWIVEAGHRSGALNTAKHAREQGRDVYATPCFPGDPCLAGNQRLIDVDGAEALWHAGALGHTWARFAKEAPEVRRNLHVVPAVARDKQINLDAWRLAEHVREVTAAQGGAETQSLLAWAIALGWPPQRFFTAFQNAVECSLMREYRGSLVPTEE